MGPACGGCSKGTAVLSPPVLSKVELRLSISRHLLLAKLVKPQKAFSGEGKGPQGGEACRIWKRCSKEWKDEAGVRWQAQAVCWRLSWPSPSLSIARGRSYLEGNKWWCISVFRTLTLLQKEMRGDYAGRELSLSGASRKEKKKKKDRCRKELFVALCSGFYLESLFIKMFSLAQTLLLLTGRPPLPPPPPSPALVWVKALSLIK